MSELRGIVWSKVLDGVRFDAPSSQTTEGMLIHEEAKASAITDSILAAVEKALTSDVVIYEHAAPEYDRAHIEHEGRSGKHVAGIRAALTAALRAAGITKGEGDV